MKKTITILGFLVTIIGYAQVTEIKYLDKILPESVVNALIIQKSANEIYNKSLNWVKESYKNPSEVIKTTIENEMIRFEGIKADGVSSKVLGSKMFYSVKYTISLYFKDNKYKFEINSVDYAISTPGANTDLKNITYCYKNSGEIRGLYSYVPTDIESLLNDLNSSLYLYIEKESTQKKEW